MTRFAGKRARKESSIQLILWKKHENGECVMRWKRGEGGGGADTHWGTRELMDKGRREKRQEIIKLN